MAANIKINKQLIPQFFMENWALKLHQVVLIYSRSEQWSHV